MNWLKAAKLIVRQNEGVRNRMYLDHLGIPTIGVGFNLTRPDARAKIGTDYDEILAGTKTLTPERIEALFDADLAASLLDLARVLPNFSELPPEVRVALLDLHFNVGPTRFRGFRKMLAALQGNDFSRAADEMTDSLWARQVPTRAARNIQRVRMAASKLAT
jgi:GH24 family phage-related lysozyme (muramidase)